MDKEKLKVIAKKEWHIPYSEKIMRVISSFSLTEKTIFFFFVVVFAFSALSLLYQVNKSFLVTVPDFGGSLTEGVIGVPRFINPTLATSDIDRDLTSLIYSGLLKTNSKGEIVPDLAESYTVTDDGLTYKVVLKDEIYFHDKTKVTADDVIFTIEMAQNPNLKSPRETNWSGVVAEKIDDKTITFTLKQPYAPFIQNLTLGILPKHIWKSATADEFQFSQYNIKPIGSGPYQVASVVNTSSGIPSEYHLESFKKYSLGRPFISNITIKAYKNEKDIIDAFKNGDIESLHGISPKLLPDLKVEKDETILSPLPRIFGVFFNQNVAPVLVYKEVRAALDLATDKQAIIDQVLGGYGLSIDSPVPSKSITSLQSSDPLETRIEKAKALLVKAGWKENETGIFEKKDKKSTVTLSFSISTGDTPELKDTANMLAEQWRKVGASVTVKIFDIGDLNQNVIRPRKYDALLFGEIIGRDMDLYPFWHSSQRNSPGLNIALYTNIKADKVLESLRKTVDEDARQKYFENFNTEIRNDIPAVFTYSPYFIYVVPQKVKNAVIGTPTVSSERFSDVSTWYIETNNVWNIFIKNKI